MVGRIGRYLRIPFRRGEQVVFLHDTELPEGGSVPAGAVAEVIRELDGGDRLFVEVLAFAATRGSMTIEPTGTSLTVERGAVRPNTMSGGPWEALGPGRHWD